KGVLVLRADDGKTTPLQCDGSRAWFILDALPAGATRTYKVEQPRKDVTPAVVLNKEGGAYTFSARFSDDNQPSPILTYQSEKTPLPAAYDPAFQRGGYIAPVRTPSGKVLTDDYPPNHKHHHGIWFPWTK